MIFPSIVDVSLLGVFDRGVPNRERVVLKTNAWVNLTEYGVMIGILQPDNLATPVCDHVFYFKDVILAPNSWIFIYTGTGKEVTSRMSDSGEPAHVFYWGKPFTVFAQSQVIPVLFRIGSVQLGCPPQNQRQLESGE